MVIAMVAATGLFLAAMDIPPVPGGCTAPAAENVGKPGCFLSAELRIESAPATLYWNIYEFKEKTAAEKETKAHPLSQVVTAHDRIWLYVLGEREVKVAGGQHMQTVGPLSVAANKPVTARFLESLFPPGMRTRVHSHPGAEAFYVVTGEQCVETPQDQHNISPGTSYIVAKGPHIQSAPKGRRSLVLLLVPENAKWMTLEEGWAPSDFCSR